MPENGVALTPFKIGGFAAKAKTDEVEGNKWIE